MPFANLPPGTPFGPDWQLRALIARQGYANGVTADVAQLLTAFYIQLRDRLESGVDFTPSERASLNALTEWARLRLNEIVPGIVSKAYAGLEAAGPVEQLGQKGQAEALRQLLGVPSRGQVVSVARFTDVIRSTDIGGLKLGEWWQKNAQDALMRMRRTIQSDMLQGFGPRDVARRALRTVEGQAALGDVHLHGIRMAVRTAMTAVSSEASKIEHREMSDVISKVEFVATLDSRTSEPCLANDGKTYILGAANIPYPPLHIGCRSSVEPVVALDALGFSSDALGKRVSYEQWFRGQAPETQNDILGVKKAGYYRQGTLTLGALISSDNTVLSLEQLKQRMTT